MLDAGVNGKKGPLRRTGRKVGEGISRREEVERLSESTLLYTAQG